MSKRRGKDNDHDHDEDVRHVKDVQERDERSKKDDDSRVDGKSRVRRLKVDYLARVEGEGAMYIKIVDGKVSDVKLKIYEPPRFFEAFLRGRRFSFGKRIPPSESRKLVTTGMGGYVFMFLLVWI
ncbi:MAG: hypothetical protein QW593_01185, partial [Candidatus Nitrosocaldus sp.]